MFFRYCRVSRCTPSFATASASYRTQRAQRSKKFNLARKFQSRRLEFPTENRAAVGGSLKNFILARNFQSRSKSRFFLIFGPSGNRKTPKSRQQEKNRQMMRKSYFLPIFSDNSRRLWLSEIPCWKGFPANFDAAGKFFPDFLAARNAIPAKVWALSGKENGCWKIGRTFRNAAGFSPPRPPLEFF